MLLDIDSHMCPTVSGMISLDHVSDIDNEGQFELGSCSHGHSAAEMLRICLSVCITMLDIGCRAVQLTLASNFLCQLNGEVTDEDVEATAATASASPLALIKATQPWRLCAEYPLRFLCSARAASNEVYTGWLCLWNEPLDRSKYNERRLLDPAASPAPPINTWWRMAFGMEVQLPAATLCEGIAPSIRAAVFALLPSVTKVTIECPTPPSPCGTSPCTRVVIWLDISRGSEDAIQRKVDDTAAMQSSWDALGSIASGIDVTRFMPSTWKLEQPYRDGGFDDVRRCVLANTSSGFMIAPRMTATLLQNVEFRPENHATLEPFYKSQTDADDLLPIPDGCFTDTQISGTPSNPALAAGGMHYELLGQSCAGNRSQLEMLQICLTICSKTDFGGPLEVDKRCIGVNYDEHGVGGHCHLQRADRITVHSSSECPRSADTVSRNGLCMKEGFKTSRPLCNQGQLLHGAPPCTASGGGREQLAAIMCFFAGDTGPSEGTTSSNCQIGQGFVGDGDDSNTVPQAGTLCRQCRAGSYSMPQPDLRLQHSVIPRPADFPAAINRCLSSHCKTRTTPKALRACAASHT